MKRSPQRRIVRIPIRSDAEALRLLRALYLVSSIGGLVSGMALVESLIERFPPLGPTGLLLVEGGAVLFAMLLSAGMLIVGDSCGAHLGLVDDDDPRTQGDINPLVITAVLPPFLLSVWIGGQLWFWTPVVPVSSQIGLALAGHLLFWPRTWLLTRARKWAEARRPKLPCPSCGRLTDEGDRECERCSTSLVIGPELTLRGMWMPGLAAWGLGQRKEAVRTAIVHGTIYALLLLVAALWLPRHEVAFQLVMVLLVFSRFPLGNRRTRELAAARLRARPHDGRRAALAHVLGVAFLSLQLLGIWLVVGPA